MPSLAFVMPAYKRYRLSDICFAQRRQCCDELKRLGVDASAVVIADDENLDLARKYRFKIVEQNNEWLGRKWNDGFEFAAKLGYDYLVAMGSDMFCMPEMFTVLPEHDQWMIHRTLGVVPPSGDRLAAFHIKTRAGELRVIPRNSLAHINYRPMDDKIKRGCDTSTWKRGRTAIPRECSECGEVHQCYRTALPEHEDCHPLELVNFMSGDNQISSYAKIRLVHECQVTLQPWDELREHYDSQLVDRIAQYYREGANGE